MSGILDCFKVLFQPLPPKQATVIPIKPDAPAPKPIESVSPVPLNPKARTLGIDLSHYEPRLVSWTDAKMYGVDWMYTKATEGTGSVDAMLKTHVSDAKAAGVLTTGYHFFRASQSAEAQASHYLQAVAGMNFELPHILDWELDDGESKNVNKQKALVWLDLVEKASGRVPIIYMGESFAVEMGLGPEFAKYPIITAHYGTTESRLKVPPPFKKLFAWQYSESETQIPGLAMGHGVDANWFFGSVDDLKAFAKV